MRVNSSNIASIDHVEEGDSSILTVEFNNGNIYQYQNVPVDLYQELVAEATRPDGSVGRMFNRLVIQGGFESEKI